ncbi:aldehyde dehydrogenase (NADP(+)) [Luteolibacter yonseiensis]|uniref:Aldehyde dehydrogenase (NADP(+)) n=1 Tax=Luteolibacter yonseiensis TaxID=1144680 RepID=A0A934VAT4_9BACT|nr:aldehyde dehydrogenase (NADP(+)) [Luteolibacter yonseiensis]MBK1814704.1 aldehyde dehydrogenase (NADP(+)) [Luteolibacter yonseiensis]
MTTSLLGTSFIGYSRSTGNEPHCNAVQLGTGAKLEPVYLSATPDEVEKAMALAAAAFPIYSNFSGKTRAGFLRAIATEIEGAVEDIVARGQLETALPEPRLRGETGRTVGQLRMFATQIEEGSWVDARIERAEPDRKPVPKVDLRSMLRPLGPVAVFCASNFPLAYSVAGGDTASALAAGCPVVVIAHEAHPGVAEIVAAAVIRAAKLTDMPEGVFSVLYGGGRTVGQAVVKHPVTQAVGFTGSRAGGTALMDIAANRPQPIPVYAEMSSINPIVILPGALERGEEALAESFFGSLTLGVGQFCTNPGLVFLPTGEGRTFLAKLKSLIEASGPGMMLHAGISKSYAGSKSAVAAAPGVETLAASRSTVADGQGASAVFTVAIADFLKNESLQKEMFGPATLIVRGTVEEIEAAIPKLEGQLTASLHATDDELANHGPLVQALQRRAGRLIFNGYPTGVEVCHSIVHGGPFPATSDGRSTSVGTMAIYRFCRPVAWQSFPDAALPPELQEANPLGIKRME